MAPQQQRTLAIGILTTVLAALTVSATRTAWESKVDKSVFDLHVQRAERDITDTREIILELLCDSKPESRRCR